MNILKKYFITIIFIFLISPIIAVDYLNNPAYIAQRGFGESEQIAKQNALAEISKFFQMSISVEANEKTKVTDAGSRSELSENIFVNSQTELFAVHYTKAKYNKKQKLYELAAYIDRNEAWQIYEPKLESAVKPFEKLYQYAESQNENILKITGFSKALENANQNELEKKLDFAVILYPDSYDLYETTRNHLSEIEPLVKKICKRTFVNVVCENDFEGRVQKGTEEIFSKIGIGTSKNAEYEFAVKVLENESKLPAGFFFTPSFTLEITKNGNVLFSSSGQLKKIGAKDETIAKQRAYSAVANAVAEILEKEFMAY